MTVILYSTDCPRCKVLKKKLNQKNIIFNEVTDIEVLKSKEYFSVPVLEVDDKVMDFKQSVDWINYYK